MTTTTTTHPRLDELRQIPLRRNLEFFSTLEAPAITELNGYYEGVALDGGDQAVKALIDADIHDEDSKLGYWLGKVYRPLSGRHGEGLNIWRRQGRIVHQLRFETNSASGEFDGRPCFCMDYRGWRHRTGELGMVDEIRRVEPDLYLGIAHVGRPGGRRHFFGAFALLGPAAPYAVGAADLIASEPRA